MIHGRQLRWLYALTLAAVFALLAPHTWADRAAPAPDPAPPVRAEKGPAARAPDDKAAEDDAGESDTDFVRFVDDDQGGGTLEAALATYRNDDGVSVTLVSALHVGEKSYYDALSKSFPGYDALLYEMVKPKNAPAPKPGGNAGGGGGVSGFQRLLKNLLELEFQLDAIDYTAENFVHADLDYETFNKLQSERGESLVSLMINSMLHEMRRQNQQGAAGGKNAPPITLIDLLVAMNAPDRARQYKLLLARQMQDIEGQVAGLEGPNGSVILTERNKAALKVLKEAIADGRKNIGVFYGAAHMHGIRKALIDDMGFKPAGVKWLVAWDMTAKAQPAPVEGGKKPAEAQPNDAVETKDEAEEETEFELAPE